MQDPEEQKLHVSDLTLLQIRERDQVITPRSTQQHWSRTPTTLRWRENLPWHTVRAISLEEFDHLFLSSVQHSQGPLHCTFRVFFDQVRVNVAADSLNEIALMSIAGTFTFTEVALLACSESRLSKNCASATHCPWMERRPWHKQC